MVAYSFKGQFEAQIATGFKRQTVRANRIRHARVGETIQLYVAMRTKSCRKIRPDVTCLAVHDIEICTSAMVDGCLASIAVNGVYLTAPEIELFAIADGFAPNLAKLSRPLSDGFTARANMGAFWMDAHGAGRFDGKLIIWGATA